MAIFVALLQGVNVGKHKRISMGDLKQIVVQLDGHSAITVANSGNVVFAYRGVLDNDQLRVRLEEAISEHVGLPVPVILRTSEEMQHIVANNPYPQVTDGKHLHVEFLLADGKDVLVGIEFGVDHLTAGGREIYLHLPNGISGLTYDARSLGKRLGTHHTSRNWNTVTRLANLAKN